MEIFNFFVKSNFIFTVNCYFIESNTLPRSKPKAPLSPSFKSTVTPPVFIPKESDAALQNLYTPSYNAQQSYVPSPQPIIAETPNYQPQSRTAPQSPLAPTRIINFNSLQNYNTAPRGWGATKTAYKPVTFDKPQVSYTDF